MAAALLSACLQPARFYGEPDYLIGTTNLQLLF